MTTKNCLELSPDQKRILQATAGNRITLVKACPGSGKTRLFITKAVELIEELDGANTGIAALSFTNAAKEVIEDRLAKQGLRATYPHFIGTVDSFLQRFIVQPFGAAFDYLHGKGLNLIPAESVESYPGFQPLSATNGKFMGVAGVAPGVNEYNQVGDGNDLRYEVYYNFLTQRISDQSIIKKISDAKSRQWKSNGCMTHNDVQVLSSWLLEEGNGKAATVIKNILAQRFRWLLIDECQDINSQMLQVLSNLIEKTDINVMAVGDPDQAIFEFGGSSGQLTDKLSDSLALKTKSLQINFRSPEKFCKLASTLSVSASTISAAEQNDNKAKLILIEHTLNKDFRPLATWQKENFSDYGTHAILSGKKNTLKHAKSGTNTACLFSSRALSGLHDASCLYKAGELSDASRTVRFVLRQLINNDGMRVEAEKDFVRNAGIGWGEWKASAIFLAKTCCPQGNETWEDWRLRVKRKVELLITNTLGLQTDGLRLGNKLNGAVAKAKKADKKTEVRVLTNNWGVIDWLPETEFKTVHKAKGLEYDSVVFFSPAADASQCPSNIWFSNNKEDLEWRRVAFVAMTRARKALAVCLHKNSMDVIRKKYPEFITLFDEVTIL